jgi:small ligand-binding sensory domain FIST
VRFVSVLAEDARSDAAVARALARGRAALDGAEPDLALLFVSHEHAGAYAEIGAAIRAELPGTLLVGSSARSVIGGGHEREEAPGLALALAELPGVELRPFALPGTRAMEPADIDWRATVETKREEEPSFLVLADPFSADAEALVAGLDAAFPGCTKLGGLASGGEASGQNALYVGDAVARSGVVGVALVGNVALDAIVAQGCRPVGAPMLVSRCSGNLILEVDGRSPLVVLQELYAAASPRDQELFRASLFGGVQMRTSATGEYRQGDFLIRNLIGADQERGALAVAARLEPGQVFQFHLRDADASAADLERCLTRHRAQSAGATGAGCAGALLFSCLGRGQYLYGRADHDTDAFRRHFGEVPLTGFFCNGEIGPVQGTTFLHGYTSAFGILHPKRAG